MFRRTFFVFSVLYVTLVLFGLVLAQFITLDIGLAQNSTGCVWRHGEVDYIRCHGFGSLTPAIEQIVYFPQFLLLLVERIYRTIDIYGFDQFDRVLEILPLTLTLYMPIFFLIWEFTRDQYAKVSGVEVSKHW